MTRGRSKNGFRGGPLVRPMFCKWLRENMLQFIRDSSSTAAEREPVACKPPRCSFYPALNLLIVRRTVFHIAQRSRSGFGISKASKRAEVPFQTPTSRKNRTFQHVNCVGHVIKYACSAESVGWPALMIAVSTWCITTCGSIWPGIVRL